MKDRVSTLLLITAMLLFFGDVCICRDNTDSDNRNR